jgi:putative heme-binding domain-containing protein
LLERAGDTKAIPLYIRLLDEPPFRAAVIPLLAHTDDPAAAHGLIRHFDQMPNSVRAAALGTLTSRPALALVLLEAVASGKFDQKHLTALHARQLRSLDDPRIAAHVDRIWGRASETSADAKATVARLRKGFTDLPLGFLDPLRGKEVYQRLCAACHKLDGDGGTLGPDLTGSSHNGLDYFLENIVDPNAVVGADYQLNVITKKDGGVVSGMIGSETDTMLVVRTATDTINVPKSDIKERQALEQSMMPAGLLEGVTQREALDLLRFLLLGRR